MKSYHGITGINTKVLKKLDTNPLVDTQTHETIFKKIPKVRDGTEVSNYRNLP